MHILMEGIVAETEPHEVWESRGGRNHDKSANPQKLESPLVFYKRTCQEIDEAIVELLSPTLES